MRILATVQSLRLHRKVEENTILKKVAKPVELSEYSLYTELSSHPSDAQ